MPVIIGLTGGIASGKSTVSRALIALGAAVLDADQIARDVVMPGQPALTALRETFGARVLLESGELDRKALGALVFADDEARAKLNAIMHPCIAQRMMEEAQAAGERGHAWVIYDAALLVEQQTHTLLDALIVVTLSQEVQLERLMARDQLSAEEAQQRMDAQLPLAAKVAVADYLVDNSGTRAQTEAQTHALYHALDEAVRTCGSARPDSPPVTFDVPPLSTP